MKDKALNTLIQIATDNIASRPISVQIEIYTSLSHLLPDPDLRIVAARVAFALSETSELQKDFSRFLSHLVNPSSPAASGPERTPVE